MRLEEFKFHMFPRWSWSSFTTDVQSGSLSWCRAPRFLFTVWQLRVSWCGAPSLTRGLVCNLLVQLLLGLARAATLWFKSRRTHNHMRLPQPGGTGPRIYIPQGQGGPVIRPGKGFRYRRLLGLAGLRWGYSNPPSHGVMFPRLGYTCYIPELPAFYNGRRPRRILSHIAGVSSAFMLSWAVRGPAQVDPA
jgi:hypothetical protein